MDELFSFGAWVRRRRRLVDLTQAALAGRVGVAAITIQKIEADERRPSLRVAVLLAEQLAIPDDQQARFLQAARGELATASLLTPGIVSPEPTNDPIPLLTEVLIFLLTDIEGSSQIWQQHPAAMSAALARHDALIRNAISQHNGTVLKGTGDGVYASFGNALDALQAALAGQRALVAELWNRDIVLRVRMALHVGLVEKRDGDYFGLALNRAARLLAVGHGGQVLVSTAAYEVVVDQLPPELSLRSLGVYQLKGLQRHERIYQVVAADLPADFPPLPTAGMHVGNLPAQATALLGRVQELADLHTLLGKPDLRLLTLTGPGGIGKTRLALQAAAEMEQEFEHGSWFVDLSIVTDPNLVAATVGQALGVPENTDQSATARLISFLRTKRMLVVLDNFEQVLDAAELVASIIREAPGVSLLATSRVPLQLYGEHELAIGPLPLPPAGPSSSDNVSQYDAVRLFITRAQAVRADFAITNRNAPAVAEICSRLDGLPLAIELAAARIRLFGPEVLLARLTASGILPLLTGGARNVPIRQQTIRNTIAWSYQLLDSDEQAVFLRLAVFVGGFDAEAVIAVCGASERDSLAIVEALAIKNLVRAETRLDGVPRFTLLETIREYAWERLAERGEDEQTRRAHAAYFTMLAEQAETYFHGPQGTAWMDRLEGELNNLRAALAWSEEVEHDSELGLRLAGALLWFWDQRHRGEGQAWLVRSVSKSPFQKSPARAKALTAASMCAFWKDDRIQAQSLVEQALSLVYELGNQTLIAWALHSQGTILVFCSNHTRGADILKQGLALFQTLDDRFGIARSLQVLGHAAELQGEQNQAVEIWQDSLILYREMGDKTGIADISLFLGHILFGHGRLADAEILWHESLRLYRANGDRWGTAMSLSHLATSAYEQGNFQKAAPLFAESVAIWRDQGSRGELGYTLQHMGNMAINQGHHELAQALFSEVSTLLGEIDAPDYAAWHQRNLARLAHMQGDDPEAHRLLTTAIALLRSLDHPYGVACCLDVLAGVTCTEGQPLQAARLFGAAQAARAADWRSWPAGARADYERDLAMLHAQLDASMLTAAWQAGQKLSLDQAVDEALEAANVGQSLPR